MPASLSEQVLARRARNEATDFTRKAMRLQLYESALKKLRDVTPHDHPFRSYIQAVLRGDVGRRNGWTRLRPSPSPHLSGD